MRLDRARADGLLLITTIILVIAGGFIFSSASLGLLSRTGGNFTLIAIKQLIVLLVGLLVLVLAASWPYKNWDRIAWPLFIFSLLLTLLVFVPGIGFASGGARRWIIIWHYTFQPAELLKFSFVVFFAAWLAHIKSRVATIKLGLVPYLVLLGIVAAVLLKQPNTSSLMIIAITGTAMFLVAGGKWRHFLFLALLGLAVIVPLVLARPYLKSRIVTFFNPEADQQGASYQINQALIAIGSGGIFGRGFGQSVQKFNFLPEPVGDSIFAVEAEEFGLIGSSTLVILFILFALAGLRVAARLTDPFGKLLAVGLVMLIVTQSFVNMAAMMGLIPVTGTPLVFISQGGSALLLALLEVGILLNISKH